MKTNVLLISIYALFSPLALANSFSYQSQPEPQPLETDNSPSGPPTSRDKSPGLHWGQKADDHLTPSERRKQQKAECQPFQSSGCVAEQDFLFRGDDHLPRP